MTRLAVVLAVLAALTARLPHGNVALAAGVLALFGLAVAWFVDCARWPGYFAVPAGPTYPRRRR